MADDLLASMQALEDYRIGLTLSGDFDTLADVLSETLVYGHSTGTRDTRASMLKLLREGTVEYVSIASTLDTASRIAAGVVLVSGMLETRVKVLGQRKELSGRYMAVWRMDGQQWKLEALQGSHSGTA